MPAFFVLGGNATTLAFVSSLRVEDGTDLTAHLVPLAQTPLGVVIGNTPASAAVPYESLAEWIDATFPAQDDRAFVAPLRDIELLARIGWHSETTDRLGEGECINIDDLPAEIADAFEQPAQSLVQCAACRRLCVAEHFVWNERQLCAWDYHRQVFGKRGPWRTDEYEERHFDALPAPAYIVPSILDEGRVEAVLAIGAIDRELAREAVNMLIRAQAGRAHLCVAVPDGYTLLRER